MINHVLLELYCAKNWKDGGDGVDCAKEAPTYECLAEKCKYCTFTSHENALCYVDSSASAVEIISLGGEMLPENVDRDEAAEALWEKISREAIKEAHDKYMKKFKGDKNEESN